MAYGLLYDFLMGQTIEAYKYFGAHFVCYDNQEGVIFRLYAPFAEDVSVIGDFNWWDVTKHKMKKVDGIANLFDLSVCFCTQREIWQFVIYFIV